MGTPQDCRVDEIVFYRLGNNMPKEPKSEIVLPLRIVLVDPPPGVDFGVQEGKGNEYKTIAIQRSKTAKLQLDCSIDVKGNRADGPPNFVGPISQINRKRGERNVTRRRKTRGRRHNPARTRTHQENQLHPSAMKLQSRNSTGAVESWSDEFRIASLHHSTTARDLVKHRIASP